MIKRCHDFPGEFYGLVQRFIEKSEEKERTAQSIKEQIRGILEKDTGAFWTIWNGEILSGYFFAEIVPTEYGSEICLIHEVMIEGFSGSLLRDVDRVLEVWARMKDVDEMAFFTRRNSNAMIRTLKNGWKVDSTVLKRKIKGLKVWN